MAEEKPIGKVSHYYDKIGVAVLSLTKPLKVGDKIRFEGHNEFTQEVASMQVQHKAVTKVKAKEEVAVKVDQPLHKNDKVFAA